MTYSNEAVAAMKAALSKSMSGDQLAKAGISTSTGLTYYDLMTPAQLQIPVLTPIRDSLARKPRNTPGGGAHWKVINAMAGSGFDMMGYVPEGQRSGVKSVSVKQAFAPYTTIGEEGSTTFEAIRAAVGLDDVLATDHLLTLEKCMMKEEAALLFGNRSNKLGTPTTPTAAAVSDANSALSATTYYAAVVALTVEGSLNSSVVNGVAQALTVTGQDGSTYTQNGGSSALSAISAGQAITSGQALALTTPAIQGAYAYAWYVGTSNAAGSLYLQAITTINSLKLETFVNTSRQLASAITADCSYNDGTQAGTNPTSAIDGLMTQAALAGNGAYYQALATGTAGTGSGFSANGTGVDEVDNMMVSMWNSYRIGVDVLYGSVNTVRNLSKKILNNNSAPLVRFVKDSNDDDGVQFTAGGMIRNYFSPIGNPYGGQKAAVCVHPYLPDGVIIGWSKTLPPHYRNNETPTVAEVLLRQDYYAIDWPDRTRAKQYGVYVDETLAVYAPWAMSTITNIALT